MDATTINWDAIDAFLKNSGHLEIESTDGKIDAYAVKDGQEICNAVEYDTFYDALKEIGYGVKRNAGTI